MIAYKDIKKYEEFRFNCPHRYKNCGSIESVSNCAQCFNDGAYNTKNGYRFEEIMK